MNGDDGAAAGRGVIQDNVASCCVVFFKSQFFELGKELFGRQNGQFRHRRERRPNGSHEQLK